MTVIRVKDLSLRTFIGFKPHEKKHKQDVLIQLEVEVETSMVEHNDDYQADGFYDYRSMTKSVIKFVEESRFDLLEALTRKVLDEIMSNPLVKKAKVEIEKPHALRYSRTVSVEMSSERSDAP
ncbi:MAG: dihydroneopterin aldolase [SAR324 cluster bacterium]|nr:dihydroneopterin aldolase [SAR324 cluster bacterium]